MWGCAPHWKMLPARIRKRILLHYRPGQEVTKDPSPEYLEIARIAGHWIDARKGVRW